MQNVAGWSFVFHVKSVGNAGWVINKSSAMASQIAIVDPANGVINIFLSPGDTQPLSPNGTYLYELIGTDSAGNTFTLDPPANVQGVFTVSGSLQP